MEVIKGIPVAPGVVIGRAFVLDEVLDRVPMHVIRAEDVPAELARLDAAWAAVRDDLEADRDRAREQLGPEPAKIFEFHLGLLFDPSLRDPVRTRVETDHVSATYAVSEAFRAIADQFRAMDGHVFREKASDVLDLDRRILAHLVGASRDRLARVESPVIVVAHDMTPAEAATLDTQKVQAVAIDAGGRTSHTSIVLAALGIPVVVGCRRLSASVDEGETLVVDGVAGVVVARPSDAAVTQYHDSMERAARSARAAQAVAEREAVTLDGTRITLLGNVEFAHEARDVVALGGDGVGLFRTEFLYLTRDREPTEDEHYEEYRRCVELLEGRPLTIRTVDLGADKYTQERADSPERNPMLGLRSIRYCLQNIPMFRTQLRAILRASAHGRIKVMFPLISTAMELRQTRMIVGDVREELEEEGIPFDRDLPIGIMVEVPSAALMASAFAREVDFFSIGTNDLIQYTLAVDRGNELVANLYTGANPAVLALIKSVIRAGRRFGVDTSLCGEIAGEPLYTMLLIGLGLRSLSLVPSRIPAVKQVVRAVRVEDCERLARKIGSFDSERQIVRTLREALEALPAPDEPERAEAPDA